MPGAADVPDRPVGQYRRSGHEGEYLSTVNQVPLTKSKLHTSLVLNYQLQVSQIGSVHIARSTIQAQICSQG